MSRSPRERAEFSPQELAYFDQLDEAPCRSGTGGTILRFERVGEFRSRRRFPRLERMRNQLALLTAVMERDEREERQ